MTAPPPIAYLATDAPYSPPPSKMPVISLKRDESKQDPSSFAMRIENDFISDRDENYSNGVKLNWMSPSNSATEGLSAKLNGILGGCAASPWWRAFNGMAGKEVRQQWGLSLTQLIFTPELKAYEPLYAQRPYAGYLALGLNAITKTEDRANCLELQFGVTGKYSLADRAQYRVHYSLEMEQWTYWKSQIPFEPQININFKRYYRLRALERGQSGGGYQTDGLLSYTAELGTAFIRTGIGATYRIGYNLPNSSEDPFIGLADSSASPFIRPNPTGNSYYLLFGAYAHAVARDVTFDGPLFHNYPSYATKYPLMFLGYTGFGIRVKKVNFTFAVQFRSREFVDQGQGQVIGSLQFRFAF